MDVEMGFNFSVAHLTQTAMFFFFQLEDQDEYTCRASNSLGSATTRAQLKLSGECGDRRGRRKPQFVARPRIFVPPRLQLGIEAEKSNSLEFSIPYKAYPSITAQWYKDDEKLAPGARFTTSVDERQVSRGSRGSRGLQPHLAARVFSAVTLRISAVEKADAGDWSVRVENAAGRDTASIRVTVADVPEPPRFPQVENILETAAVLSWKVRTAIYFRRRSTLF